MIETCKLRPEELALYAENQKHAGDWQEAPVTSEEMYSIDPDSVWGVFVDGNLVSGLRNILMRQSVRGVEKRMGGIGGVGTHPQYRLQGHVRRLMAAALEEMPARGQVVSTLYPFKESFYMAYGYISTNANLRVEIAGRHLAHHIAESKALAGNWQVDVIPMAEARDAMVAFQRRAVLPNHTGYVIDPDRPEVCWRGRARDNLIAFVQRDGETEAMARYWIQNDTLHIHELHWLHPAARTKLLAFLAVYQDQTPTMWLVNLPLGTNVYAWLRDAGFNLRAALVTTAPMVRVVDPVGALAGLPGSPDGEVAFTLQDEQCAWNNGVYRVKAQAGELAAEKVAESAELSFSIQGLTALVYGILPVAEIEYRGWITGLADAERRLLQEWFTPQVFFSTYFF